MNSLNLLLLGAVAMASLAAAMFFLRFWRRTHDRFFAFFSLAFAMDAIDRVALAIYWGSETDNPAYFLIRFISYGIIVAAIIDKNLNRKSDS